MTGTLLAEGFDQYATTADMASVGWGGGSGSIQAAAQTPFTQGQSLAPSTTAFTYNWGSNETTVYGSVFYANNATSSSSIYFYLALRDGTTNQVTIRWNMDGSIGLYSGGPTGTLISTTTSLFTGGTSAPYSSFQFKIVIDATVGSIEVRVNGSPTNSITATGVNTRAGTSNSYVNTVAIALGSGSASAYIDNLYLTTTGWPGEMRALQQRPTTVVTPNFSVFGPATQVLPGITTGVTESTNTTYYKPFTAARTGTIGSATFTMNANMTGNVKFAIYDSTGSSGAPGTALATSGAVNNPTTSTNTATFSSPPLITAGVIYYFASVQDASANYIGGSVAGSFSSATSYASFPVNTPTFASGPATLSTITATLNITLTNAAGIQELIQDGDTTYIYTSSNVEDKYHLTSIATTYAVSAVQYYACWKKTDGGYRTASLSVDANGSGDTNLITTVPPLIGSYSYTIKTMDLDPTGAAWTPTNVNGAILGIAGGS